MPKPQNIHPSMTLQARFQKMAQYGDSVGWDLDFRQLEKGTLDARVCAIKMAFGVILQVNFNRAFHQVGCAPKGLLTFGIPDVGVCEFGWCASKAKGGTLLNFNLESGFEGVSPAGFNGHTFSFDANALQDFAVSLGFDTALASLIEGSSYWNTTGTITLGHHLRQFSRVLAQNGPKVLSSYSEMINEEIATCILECLNGESEECEVISAGQKHVVLKRSMDILDNPDRLPITVARLCAEVATSLSTLKRVFLAEFGVLPKAYIRARCLSAIRDDLAKFSPGTRIVDVANKWGFWHMGQFARDYRAMFGELPSNTLKRQ